MLEYWNFQRLIKTQVFIAFVCAGCCFICKTDNTTFYNIIIYCVVVKEQATGKPITQSCPTVFPTCVLMWVIVLDPNPEGDKSMLSVFLWEPIEKLTCKSQVNNSFGGF